MTEERALYWAEYATELAGILNLGHWHIGISYEPAPDGCSAQISIPNGRRRVAIRFAHDFDTFDPDRQRQTIVHELEHLRFHNVDRLAEWAAERMKFDAGQLFAAAHLEALEFAIDEIAELLADQLPLPKARR